MKRFFEICTLIIGTILCLDNTYAASSGTCGKYNESTKSYDECYWSLDEDGKLTITGSGQMADYDYAGTDNAAPWGTNISEINISGITSVGGLAFISSAATSAKIGASVEMLNNGAFQAMPNLQTVEFAEDSRLSDINVAVFQSTPKLTQIQLPEHLSYLGHYNFHNSGIKSLILPDSLFEESARGLQQSALTNIEYVYCSKANQDLCAAYLTTAQKFVGEHKPYEPLTGIELKIYEYHNGQYYCDGKFYGKVSDIGTTNHIKKRIYTIDEANRVAGQKNRVSIKYR